MDSVIQPHLPRELVSFKILANPDSKKIAEYVDGTSPKKTPEEEKESTNTMSEEIAVDKDFILQELKIINMKNWQSIVSENVHPIFHV